MIWNCDGEIKEIGFQYSDVFKDYYCLINEWYYAWRQGTRNAGPWDWFREGYTLNWSKWRNK